MSDVTPNKTGPSTPHRAEGGSSTGRIGATGPSPSNGGPDRSLITRLREHRPLSVDPKVKKFTQFPKAIRWTIESLARKAGSSRQTTVDFLLSIGLPLVLRGRAADIRTARAHLLDHGSTEDRYWLDTCPPPEIRSGDAGFSKWAVRIDEHWLEEAGDWASALGMELPALLLLAVMAALAGSDVVRPEYRAAIMDSLRAFDQLLARRLTRAQALVNDTPAREIGSADPEWTDWHSDGGSAG